MIIIKTEYKEIYYVTLFKYQYLCKLMVSKFQKQIFLFSFEPKNERNYFLNSALRIQNRSYQRLNESIMLNNPLIDVRKCLHFFDLTHF